MMRKFSALYPAILMISTSSIRRICLVTFAFISLLLGCGETDNVTQDNTTGMPDEAVYVVNSGSNSVSVINAQTHTVSNVITLANFAWPYHINLSPDGKSLVIGVPGTDVSGGHSGGFGGGHGGAMKGSLIVLDMQTGTVKASKSLSAMNHNGVFSPDGKEIWTALATEPAKVQIYDMGLATLMKEIPVGNQPTEVTFSKEGQYAFVTNSGSGTVTVIDVSTKTVKTTIPVGETPVGAWMGVDGRMYVNNEQSQTVSVIDPSSLAVVQTIPLGFMPGSVATPPALDEFWVSDPDGAKVHYYRQSDGSHLGVFNVGAGAHAIAFNASGTTGYVTNQLANTVSVMDVMAHTVTKTIKVGIKPSGLVWRMK